MDTADYLHLDNYLRTHCIPSGRSTASRSPISAVHHVPLQPGWDSVLVMWDASPAPADNPHGKLCMMVGVLDYVPTADMHYVGKPTEGSHRTSRNPLGFHPFEEPPQQYDTVEAATKRFADLVAAYAENCGC